VLVVLAGTWWTIAAAVAALPVWVQVSSALDCPPPSSLLTALRQRIGAERVHTDEAPRGSLVLRVEPYGRHGASLRLEHEGVRIVERSIDVAAGECGGLAETLALVTESWIPAAASTAASNGLPPAPVPAAGGRDTATARAGTVPSSPPAARSSPLEPATHLSVETAVGSAHALDIDASAVVFGRASAELSTGRWRFGLRGLLETRGDLVSDGAIKLRHSTAEALVAIDLYVGAALTITPLLAAGVNVLTVSASGYSRPAPGTVLEPTVALGVRGEWRALEPLGLTAGIDGVLALQRERFSAALESDEPTARVRTRISIGALWHLL
jgi:hypothetical protein